MFCRLRPLISWLSIALLAMDAVVGAAGHSHVHHDAVDASHEKHAHACGHHHDGDHERSDGDDSKIPADDCSLCRHFSQPVVVATVTIEVSGSDLIEPLVVRTVVRRALTFAKSHTARGPPAICA